jgi:protein ImuA
MNCAFSLLNASPGLHEIYGAAGPDAPALTGAALMLAAGKPGRGALLWVRQSFIDSEAGLPSAAGLAELGLDPARIIRVRAGDVLAALQAGLEGARCSTLGGAVVELWGEARAYDLTASRRLALAAREAGIGVLVVRAGATPRASAAETRWSLSAAPSRALGANAPGPPAFALTLLRARDGREGQVFHVEWDRDVRAFAFLSTHRGAGTGAGALPIGQDNGDDRRTAAALSGAVVALPAGRAAQAALRRTG